MTPVDHFEQIICIVLDGVGIGQAPDADRYGDAGSDSLGNTARHVGALRLPVLGRMGLGNIVGVAGVPPTDDPVACYGRMCPASAGKDSTSGHWELMGCVLDTPFPIYPEGFPPDVVAEFERTIGRKVIGNRPASGTAIIQALGEEHLQTGRPILYTSQDSVWQLAVHADVMGLDELYRICEIARSILTPPHGVARVIARPFTGAVGGFYRTPDRRDFSLLPPRPTLLDALTDEGKTVVTIGKVSDLFCGRGITETIATKNNREGMKQTLDVVRRSGWDFVFVNLVDFDTMWGHRNDPRAYALGLEEFDSYLNGFLEVLGRRALLLITSDHGNDPTTESTDHSREYVPLIVYHTGMEHPVDLGTRDTLADVAATIADNFGMIDRLPGTSFLDRVTG
jgi:phosphopentomutase